MIVDSTADEGDLVSRPSVGAAAGVVGALAMLAVVAFVQGTEPLENWLDQVGRALRLPGLPAWPAVPAAVGLHLAVGAVLGALHAACQQRTAVSGLIVVGAFYGFLIWLIGGLVVTRWWQPAPPLSTWWPGLAANLAFGVVLGTWAACAQQLSAGRPAPVRPVD
jgi:ribose/xylose/arabinose/galactoside ABC-type transport system permease subunit